jgi:hypothetical protein
MNALHPKSVCLSKDLTLSHTQVPLEGATRNFKKPDDRLSTGRNLVFINFSEKSERIRRNWDDCRISCAAVAGCRLVGCSVVSGRPLCSVCVECLFLRTPSRAPYGTPSACAKRAAFPSPPRIRAVARVSQRFRGLSAWGPSGLLCPVPACAAAAALRGKDRVPIAGWGLGGVGPDRIGVFGRGEEGGGLSFSARRS